MKEKIVPVSINSFHFIFTLMALKSSSYLEQGLLTNSKYCYEETKSLLPESRKRNYNIQMERYNGIIRADFNFIWYGICSIQI